MTSPWEVSAVYLSASVECERIIVDCQSGATGRAVSLSLLTF